MENFSAATAALIERRAERDSLPFRATPLRNQRAREIDRRPFKRTAADGA
jgi:hypothetical protein